MIFNQTPSTEILKVLLVPDFGSGRIFYRPRPIEMFPSERIFRSWNSRFSGAEAFNTLNTKGYFYGRLLEQRYLRHRVIWKMAHGNDPDEIDHINRNPADNRIENLRASTRSENNINRRMSKYNTSGHVGIYQQNDAHGFSWVSQIKRNGNAVHLGRFQSIEEAVAARMGAEAAIKAGL